MCFPEKLRKLEELKEYFLDSCWDDYLGIAADAGEKAATGEENINWAKAMSVHTATVGKKPKLGQLQDEIAVYLAKQHLDFVAKEVELTQVTAKLLAEHQTRAYDAEDQIKRLQRELAIV